MTRSRAAAAALAGLVASVSTLLALVSSPAIADHELSECYQPTLSPTPTPSPEPTTPPTPPPSPPPECLPEEGDVIRGTRTVSFEVDPTDSRRIMDVGVELLAETNGVPDPGPLTLVCAVDDSDDEPNVCEHTPGDAPGDGIYSFVWNSNSLTPHNGSYALSITARSCAVALGGWRCNLSQHDNALERTKLKVDNPPAQPAAPRVLVATETSVTLEWDKAPYPDVISYTIYRARTDRRTDEPDDDAFTALLTTTPTVMSIRDEVSAPGAYWYKVAVTRRSVVDKSGGISSEQSAASGPGVVAAPEPTPAPDGPPPPPPRQLKPFVAARPPPVPDAPFSAVLPYDVPEGGLEATGPDVPEEGSDPRGPVLPLAVGAFLVSASLALVRMPY